MTVKQRFLLGMTGTFGSGKSTVAKILKSQGAKVIDCDRLVHEVYEKRRNPVVYARISKLFGAKKLERREIGKIVFSDRSKRKKLEAIVHPYVKKRIHDNLSKMKRGIIMIEVPLLFESGFDKLMDYTVTVSAPEKAIFSRLRKLGIPEAAVKLRLKSQLPIKEKAKRSNFIIVNSGSFQKLRKQAVLLYKKLNEKLQGDGPKRDRPLNN